jgi:hypothetical protein
MSEPDMSHEHIALLDQARQRREVFTRRVLDTLRGTIRVRPVEIPDVPLPRMYLEMTDDSARAIAPLIDAVEILQEIIWTTDGCVGHRNCAHSMEPWQRARALILGLHENRHDGRPRPDVPIHGLDRP